MKKTKNYSLDRTSAGVPGQWPDLQGVVPGTSDPCFYHDILEP